MSDTRNPKTDSPAQRTARYSRSRHRSANHQSAHAAIEAPGNIPQHPLVPRNAADLIETDIPVQLGPLLYRATSAPPTKTKYFQFK